MSILSLPLSFAPRRIALAFILAILSAFSTHAEDLKMDVQLIWGTNDEKSPNPKHKPVEATLDKKLKKIFKWKNYFEVNRQRVDVPSRQTKKIVLSDKCSVEVVELEGPKVEVRLWGEGKLINKTVKGLTVGEVVAIAGEDKNESAWFVILQQLEAK